MLTDKANDQLLVDSFEGGAIDFIKLPVDKLVFKARIKTALAAREYEKYLEKRVEARIADLQSINVKLTREVNERKQKEKALHRSKRELLYTNRAYERFVPRDFLRHLNKKNIIDVALGNNVEQKMSVLFADIRSFTTISESMTPEETFKLLNSYLSQIGPLVRSHRGFIDKYIGDAIMALFDVEADDAVKGAIAMFHKLTEYNTGRKKAGYQPLQIGIGINTGDLMLGTIGEHNRMEGTVISDAVNLASRLEGLTKFYGAPLLISEYTYHHLKDASQYTIRYVDRVQVKGKMKPVVIYAVMDGETLDVLEKKVATAAIFEQGWKSYQAREFKEAISLFQQCVTQVPEDKTARLYLERCQIFLKEGCDEEWDGVTHLDTK
ncbi:MAG: hypothetical protein HQM14_05025 [SAR324 cluster bacterium]|nr:hypothetical protein [SAR324 cluster bacterium]